MKKNFYFLLIFAALLLPWTSQGQSTSPACVTLFDSTETSTNVPFYSHQSDNYTRINMIMPASELQEIAGMNIGSITYYIESTDGNINAPTSIYMKEVTITSLTAPVSVDSLTLVYTGTTNTGSEGSLTITLNTPFRYSGNNNLLIVIETTPASWKYVHFYGKSNSGFSGWSFASTSLGPNYHPTNFHGTDTFLPKTTFCPSTAMPEDTDYLHFVSVADNDTIKINAFGFYSSVNVEYSTDKTSWSDFMTVGGSTGVVINQGDTLWLRAGGATGKNTSFSTFSTGFYYFSFSDSTYVRGNTMSLLDAQRLQDTVPSYAFYSMFLNCSKLLSAPKLPATKLSPNCYYGMFNGCSALKEAPELPATTLATYCYQYMFSSCSSLETAPELPATTMSDFGYSYMFNGCTSLQEAPVLPATTLANNCYNGMFAGCSSLQEAPELPVTTLVHDCYSYMFKNCTSLTKVPSLPATEIPMQSYSSMFQGCTGLTDIPQPAYDTLGANAFSSMYNGCSNLVVNTEAPGKPWSIDNDVATASLFANNMFASTGGTFTGAPVKGTTYYIQSAPHIVYDANGGENAPVDSFYTNIVLPQRNMTKAGYVFASWNTQADGLGEVVFAGSSRPVEENDTLYAIWTPDLYTITVQSSDEDMGIATGNGTYFYGDAATLTAIPNPGYKLVSWNDGDTNTTRTIIVTSDSTFIATFAIDVKYTVTLMVKDTLGRSDKGGTVTGEGSYREGDLVTVTATADEDYTFLAWYDENGEVADYRTAYPFHMGTEDVTLTALFACNNVGINRVDIAGATIISRDNSIVVRGAEQQPVQIYDLAGRLVAQTNSATAEQTFAMSHPGLYLVRIANSAAARVIVR